MGGLDGDMAMPSTSIPVVAASFPTDIASTDAVPAASIKETKVEDMNGSNAVHTPEDPEAHYTEDHRKERAERRARREELAAARKRIQELPVNHLWEVPGRPNVLFGIRAYDVMGRIEAENIWKNKRSTLIKGKDGQELLQWPPSGREYLTKQELALKRGRTLAREELPFLFKAFEQGQKAPPRPGTKRAEKPRAATIHEYLDWTVTASEPQDPDELDFAGFRVFVLFPRFRLHYPPPNTSYPEETLKHPGIGAPLPPIPYLMAHQKPICAATVRVGPTWLEVPFYATQESRRNKGVGRALLECIEDVARYLEIPRLLLCSTDDTRVKNTWQRLGFSFSSKDRLEEWGVTRHDLLHMDNTVQMHKEVPPQRNWKPVLLKHGNYKARLYYLPGGGNTPPVPKDLLARLLSPRKSGGGTKKPAKKPPPKRRRR